MTAFNILPLSETGNESRKELLFSRNLGIPLMTENSIIYSPKDSTKRPILAQEFAVDFIEGEIWKDVVGFEGIYLVSNLGRIQVVATSKLKFPRLNNKGFYMIHLYKKRTSKTIRRDSHHSVTHLVATAFIGECPKNYQARNKNGILTDNRVENIEYIKVI